MKSYIVKASICAPAVETVVNAESELEAQMKALALLRQKLALVKQVARVEICSEFKPNAEKASHLLQR